MRVQAHAAAALINFAEPCEANVLQGHMEELLTALQGLLSNSPRNVQEQAITAIAGLAENSKDGFQRVHFPNETFDIHVDLLNVEIISLRESEQ